MLHSHLLCLVLSYKCVSSDLISMNIYATGHVAKLAMIDNDIDGLHSFKTVAMDNDCHV